MGGQGSDPGQIRHPATPDLTDLTDLRRVQIRQIGQIGTRTSADLTPDVNRVTPWSPGAPPLTAVPTRHHPSTSDPPWVMARYRDRPEARAKVLACRASWRRLQEMSR